MASAVKIKFPCSRRSDGAEALEELRGSGAENSPRKGSGKNGRTLFLSRSSSSRLSPLSERLGQAKQTAASERNDEDTSKTLYMKAISSGVR